MFSTDLTISPDPATDHLGSLATPSSLLFSDDEEEFNYYVENADAILGIATDSGGGDSLHHQQQQQQRQFLRQFSASDAEKLNVMLAGSNCNNAIYRPICTTTKATNNIATEIIPSSSPLSSVNTNMTSFNNKVTDQGIMMTPCNPSDITGQEVPSLAQHMEEDKHRVLKQMETTKTNNKNKNEEHLTVDQTQNYIEELEEFIAKLEKQDNAVNAGEEEEVLEQMMILPNVDGDERPSPAAFKTAAETFVNNAGNNIHQIANDNNTQLQQQEPVFMGELIKPEPAENNVVSVQDFFMEEMDTDEGCPIANSTLTDAETSEAEKMLDALIKGRLTTNNTTTTVDNSASFSSSSGRQQQQLLHDDSGYVSSHHNEVAVRGDATPRHHHQEIVTTEEGETYIIIVTDPELPEETTSCSSTATVTAGDETSLSVAGDDDAASPAMSSSWQDEESDDSDWTPDSPAVRTTSRRKSTIAKKETRAFKKPGRKLESRNSAGRVIKKSQMVKDKKERKKLQNVEAARRYRDKKKNEQQILEDEEAELATKNKELRMCHAEIEGEIQTLKRMLLQMGYLKSI